MWYNNSINNQKGEKYEPIWINEEYLNSVLVDEFVEKRLNIFKASKEAINIKSLKP